MHLGRALGRAVLALVDALAAGVVAGLAVWFAVPVIYVETRTQLVLIAAGSVTGVVLAASLALVGLGKRPFPATRLSRAGLRRVPWWWG